VSGSGPLVDKLRERMVKEAVDGFLVTAFLNWKYISGFRGDAGALLVTDENAYLFTDSRYIEEAQKGTTGFTVRMTTVETDEIRSVVQAESLKRLAFEKEHVTYSTWEKFKERFEGVELVGVAGWVEDLRMVKTPEEIACIEKAQEIADDAFPLLAGAIHVGSREIDLALELEFTMRKMGSEGLAFPIIAVAGERSSLPHGVPTENQVSDGDFLTLDFGAKHKGYCSDETRTLVVGRLDKKHEEIYNVVLEAQLAGLEAVKPDVKGMDVDAAGRKVIEEAGYGQYFGHGIGHGVGLNVHEGPAAGKKSETILQPGMVVTVEPGIYIPGFGGCRIEDLVLVTETGHRVLSSSPKELTVIDRWKSGRLASLLDSEG
jgi:Xaa-Pro aminopeptidase